MKEIGKMIKKKVKESIIYYNNNDKYEGYFKNDNK